MGIHHAHDIGATEAYRGAVEINGEDVAVDVHDTAHEAADGQDLITLSQSFQYGFMLLGTFLLGTGE